ncbi:uncharacterized protein N7515_007406 [Penicillium bovifimosum]|uniref:J domain-containing protein n=1 Tax=Penicillium bovifimosum TaxID=126998 RepID=A0A9W9GWJ3_9EURO|nr:uncharacterized protein N7515_007406 [Penicillium bovifimosum]KAJ5131367.1 hypothetical protein N7515_007406 [Penicillium bovifimosum]
MVKADVRKDYYADLGLQPSAEPEEIKKQFRKLALKFHPDRNPGREVEFIAKFQAIQAANEILSDPTLRLKYDTDRLRAGYGKVYGPPKANTQRKAQPPTNPRPTETYSTPRQSQTPRSGPSAGAQRYAYQARAGSQWKQQDNAQTRADAFRGFNNMRGGQASGWQGFDPATGRATAGGAAGSGPQRGPFGNSAQSSRAKSAFEARQSANTAQSAKKKQGFAPGAAGGDEPMARNTSAYSNSSRTERPSSQYFNPAPPPTAKKAASPEPSQPQSRHSFTPDLERTSRGYAQTGKGEKTFFSSAGLGRSSTMRTPSGSHQSAQKGSSPAFGGSGRHRSASPKARRTTANYDSTSSSESSELTDSEEEIPKPKAVPKSRLKPHQTFANAWQGGSASPGNGMGSTFFPAISRGAKSLRLPNGGLRFYSLSKVPHSKKRTHADMKDFEGHTSDSAAFSKSSFRPDQQPSSSGSSSSVKYDRLTFHYSKPRLTNRFGSSTDHRASNAPRPQSAAFGRSSTSNLHKKFSADDWRDHLNHLDFLGSVSPGKEPFPRSPVSQSRTRTPNRNGTAKPSTTGSPLPNPFGTTPMYQGSQPAQPQQPTPFAQAKFSADQWAAQLRNLSWTVPEAEKAKATANAAPPRSPKKQPRAGTKVRSAPQPASVATEAEEANGTFNDDIPPTAPAAPDVEAMDLDEEFSTPPDQPPIPAKVSPDAPPVKKSKPPHPTEGVANTDSRAPLFSLDNLRNTIPLGNATGGGIENLEDIHTTLPFESQAKQQKTTQSDIRPRLLQLPNPPKRPWAPKPVLPTPTSRHLVLPRDKWNWYVSAMGAYMHEWNAFNGRMLTHFNARHEANKTGLAPGWISAVGDSTRLKMNGTDDDDTKGNDKTAKDLDDHVEESLVPGTNKGGYSAYLRGIEEDIQVRKHWDVACEMHRECILDLGRLREWIREGGRVA